MAEQSKKIVLYIFLFALFVTLSFFIGVNTYNVYISGTRSSEKTTKSSLECSPTFTISMIKYNIDSNTLSFNMQVSDELAYNAFMIESEEYNTEIVVGNFMDYQQNVKVDNFPLVEKFVIYPKGCKKYNAKECSIPNNKCTIIRQ